MILAQSCAAYAFRVLVNLSHASGEWSADLLARQSTIPAILRCLRPSASVKKEEAAAGAQMDTESEELVSPAIEDDRAAAAFDRLCLALALLTNLVQSAEGAKDVLRETCTFLLSSPNLLSR